MSNQGDAWVVEVLGDGTGARHQRYLVGTDDRHDAIKAVMLLVGADVVVTCSTPLADKARKVAALRPGQIKPI